MNHVPSPNDQAHQDGVLMAEVAEVNTLLGRYVLRFLDADAGRAPEMAPADERALAEQVAGIAKGLRERAARREQRGDPPPLIEPTTTTR